MLVVAVAALIGAAIVGATLLTREADPAGATTTSAQWESYVLRGRTLIVEAPGDSCAEVAEVSVDESEERVVVTLRVETDEGSCADSAAPLRGRVQLEARLGDRPVYDGACLAEEDAARRCRRGD